MMRVIIVFKEYINNVKHYKVYSLYKNNRRRLMPIPATVKNLRHSECIVFSSNEVKYL